MENTLKTYKDQVSAYLEETKPISLPLLSWDIHMNNMNTVTRLSKDVAEIGKITEKLFVDVDITDELQSKNKVIVITDTNLKIEFASSNMVKMTGYLPNEVIGNSPKIFQGEKTDKKITEQIRRHVNAKEFFEKTLINYKKDKSMYSCHIKAYPIFDKKGNCVKFVAVEDAA